MSHYTTVWRTVDLLKHYLSMVQSVLNLLSGQNQRPQLCVLLYHRIISGPVFDRSAISVTQAGWRAASLSSCRPPLLLWHLLGWALPASPPGRFVVLRHRQCRSPLGSLMHLKFKKINTWSLTIQYIMCNKLSNIRSVSSLSSRWQLMSHILTI